MKLQFTCIFVLVNIRILFLLKVELFKLFVYLFRVKITSIYLLYFIYFFRNSLYLSYFLILKLYVLLFYDLRLVVVELIWKLLCFILIQKVSILSLHSVCPSLSIDSNRVRTQAWALISISLDYWWFTEFVKVNKIICK